MKKKQKSSPLRTNPILVNELSAHEKNLMVHYRKVLFSLVLMVSFIFSSVSLLISNEYISVAVLTLLNLSWIAISHQLIRQIDDGKIDLKSLIDNLRTHWIKLALLFLIYLLTTMFLLFLVHVLRLVPNIFIFLPSVLFILFVLTNILSHLLLSYTISDRFSLVKAFKKSMILMWGNRKIFIYTLLKYIKIALLGSLVIYLVIVFVNANAINVILETSSNITEQSFDSIFSSPLSNFISNTGMQVVIGYAIIKSTIIFNYVYRQSQEVR